MWRMWADAFGHECIRGHPWHPRSLGVISGSSAVSRIGLDRMGGLARIGIVRLAKLTVRQFRNIGFASLELKGSRHFFVGANGQGKTNLLEAAGYISALRSFRTLDQKLLIMTGQPTAAISCEIEHERRGG